MENLVTATPSSFDDDTNPIILGDNSLITALFKNPKTAEKTQY